MLISSQVAAQDLGRIISAALLHDSGVQSQVFLERSSVAKLQSAKWQFDVVKLFSTTQLRGFL